MSVLALMVVSSAQGIPALLLMPYHEHLESQLVITPWPMKTPDLRGNNNFPLSLFFVVDDVEGCGCACSYGF